MSTRSETLTLLLAGDVMTGRAVDQVLAGRLPAQAFGPSGRSARQHLRAAERRNGPIPTPVAPDYIWGDALARMDALAPALRIVNLATAITSASTQWVGKESHCRMNPDNVACLAVAGLSGCTLANDHVLDWDYPGLRETLSCLEGAGIAGAGAGLDEAGACAAARLETPGGGHVLLGSWATPLGLPAGWAATATRPGVALLPGLGDADAREVKNTIDRQRRAGDLVVVSLHWGEREARLPAREQREFAHRLIDLGVADVVHGHHALAPLPMEVYKGRLILYGCGDLINDLEGDVAGAPARRTDAACLYAVTLARADGALRGVQVLPFQRHRFQLRQPDAATSAWLRSRLSRGDDEFAATVGVDGQGDWHLGWGA